jgi:hypothetical protein
MANIRAIYDETEHCLREIGFQHECDISQTRKISSNQVRYCLQNNILYWPKNENLFKQGHRLTWFRARDKEIMEELHPWVFTLNEKIPVSKKEIFECSDFFGSGLTYSRRALETGDGRLQVESLCAQALIDEVAKDPDVIEKISSRDFECLTAELYARMGFEVELFRTSKDDGIDFLAIKSEEATPFVLAVQCKRLEKKKTVGVSYVRELYGVTKAYDFNEGLVISSREFSPKAKEFRDLKPKELSLANRKEVIHWALKYRWNSDE